MNPFGTLPGLLAGINWDDPNKMDPSKLPLGLLNMGADRPAPAAQEAGPAAMPPQMAQQPPMQLPGATPPSPMGSVPSPMPQGQGGPQGEGPGFMDKLGTVLGGLYGQGGPGDALITLGAGLASRDGWGKGLMQANAMMQAQGQQRQKAQGLNQTAALISQKMGIPIEQAMGLVQSGGAGPALAQMFRPPAAPQLVERLRPDGSKEQVWMRPGEADGVVAGVSAAPARIDNDARQREQLITSRGLDPKNPQNQAFILTGRLPREDQQPLSASDKKAIMSAEDDLPVIQNTKTALQRALDLNRQTFTGFGSGARALIGSALPDGLVPDIVADPQTARNTREFQQITSMEAVKTMAETLKGATTDREMANFVELLANPNTPPEIRERTLQRMANLADRQEQIAKQRVNDLRGGTYFKPGGGQSGEMPAAPMPAPAPQQSPVQQPAVNRPDATSVLQQAKAAIGRGADRAAVMKRLQENGYDPAGL